MIWVHCTFHVPTVSAETNVRVCRKSQNWQGIFCQPILWAVGILDYRLLVNPLRCVAILHEDKHMSSLCSTGEHTRISLNTKNIFIDITATDLTKVRLD